MSTLLHACCCYLLFGNLLLFHWIYWNGDDRLSCSIKGFLHLLHRILNVVPARLCRHGWHVDNQQWKGSPLAWLPGEGKQGLQLSVLRLRTRACGSNDQLAFLVDPALFLSGPGVNQLESSSDRRVESQQREVPTYARFDRQDQACAVKKYFLTRRCKASRTSSSIHLAVSRLSRISTFVLTLFTFWPPAPPLRANMTLTSSVAQQRALQLYNRPGNGYAQRQRISS